MEKNMKKNIYVYGASQVVLVVKNSFANAGDTKDTWSISGLGRFSGDCLANYGIAAERKAGAPGVYVAGDKIAALGLRVRNGCSYHGLALNVHMDIAPFTWINPCGYSGLRTIQMADFGITEKPEEVGERLLGHLAGLLPPVRESNPARQQEEHAATRG